MGAHPDPEAQALDELERRVNEAVREVEDHLAQNPPSQSLER